MSGSPASTSPPQAPTRLERAEADARAAGEQVYRDLANSTRLLIETLRFIGFLLCVLVGTLYVWAWLLGLVLAAIRAVIGVVFAPLLWLTDGPPHHPDGRRVTVNEALTGRLQLWWSRRDEWYRDIARPMGRYVADVQLAGLRFWHFSLPRKFVVVLAGFLLIVVPLSYVIPRPHYIQVLDDDVLDYGSGTTPTAQVRYLVHAVDLFEEGQTREYRNEDAWWLGKINSQGMKARLQPGRFYKVWVVGLRWWYFPTLYPNLISVTEVDRSGRPLATPSHLIPPTTTGR